MPSIFCKSVICFLKSISLKKGVIIMSTFILREKIAAMEPGTIFTTQSLLGESPARRNTIDVMLHRMARKRQLQHLAQGVYRTYSCEPLPPVEVVAKIKAESFHRNMCGCADGCCKHAVITIREKKQRFKRIVFAIRGSTSSFKYKKMRVVLRSTSAKKLFWCNSKFGQVLRQLAQIGQRDCSAELVAAKLRNVIEEVSSDDLCRFAKLIPGWL